MKSHLIRVLPGPAPASPARQLDRFKEAGRRPAEVLLSRDGMLYIVCPVGPLGRRASGGYLFAGPYDPDRPLAEQMAGRPKELAYVSSRWAEPRLEGREARVLAGGGSAARVDLYDFIANQEEAVRAMRAGDERALRKVCPIS